jgi:hypothetical protein
VPVRGIILLDGIWRPFWNYLEFLKVLIGPTMHL